MGEVQVKKPIKKTDFVRDERSEAERLRTAQIDAGWALHAEFCKQEEFAANVAYHREAAANALK